MSSNGNSISVSGDIDWVGNSKNSIAVEVVNSKSSLESLGQEVVKVGGGSGVGSWGIDEGVEVKQQSSWLNGVQVLAKVNLISVLVGDSDGLSNSSSVGIDLQQAGSSQVVGHWVRKSNEGNWGSLEQASVDFVGGKSGNSSSVLWVVQVSDSVWSASKSSINGSDQSGVRWVDEELDVGSKWNSDKVLGVVLGNLSSISVDDVGGDDVVNGVHVDHGKVSGGGGGNPSIPTPSAGGGGLIALAAAAAWTTGKKARALQ